MAKFFVLMFYLFMEAAAFLAVFVVAGMVATSTMGITETLPVLYPLKWCVGLFLTMLPCLAALIISLLPLATFVPVFLKITLPDGVRTVWAICNIVLALAASCFP